MVINKIQFDFTEKVYFVFDRNIKKDCYHWYIFANIAITDILIYLFPTSNVISNIYNQIRIQQIRMYKKSLHFQNLIPVDLFSFFRYYSVISHIYYYGREALYEYTMFANIRLVARNNEDCKCKFSFMKYEIVQHSVAK